MKSGLSYISERTNQLRYSNKDKKEEWIQQLSSYHCLVPIKRGQAVSIATPEDIKEVQTVLNITDDSIMKLSETLIVPTNTSRHEYSVGIALESVRYEDLYDKSLVQIQDSTTFNLVPIHVQNIGRFVYDTYTIDEDKQSLSYGQAYYKKPNEVSEYYIPNFLLDYKNNIGKTVWVKSNIDHTKKCWEENDYGILTINDKESYSAYNNIIKIGHISDAQYENGSNDIRNIGSIEIQIDGDTRGLLDSTQFEAEIGESCSVPLKENFGNVIANGADLPIRIFALGQNNKEPLEFYITENDTSTLEGFVGIQNINGKTVIANIGSGFTQSQEDTQFQDIHSLAGYGTLEPLTVTYSSIKDALNACLDACFEGTSEEFTVNPIDENRHIYKYSYPDIGGYYYVYLSTSLRENGKVLCNTTSHGSQENLGKAVLADVRIPERQNIIGAYYSNIFDIDLLGASELVNNTALFVKTGMIVLPDNFEGKFDKGKTYYLGANGTITTNPYLNIDRIIKIGFAQDDRRLVLDIITNDNIYNDDIPVGYIKPSVKGAAEYGFLLMDGVTPHSKSTYENLYSRCKNMFSSQDLKDSGNTFTLPLITFKDTVTTADSINENNQVEAYLLKDYPCQIKYLADSIYNGVAFPREFCKKDWGVIGYKEVDGSLQEKDNSINYPITDIDITDLMSYGPNWENSYYGINIEDLSFSMFVDLNKDTSNIQNAHKWVLLSPGFHLYNNTEYFGYTYTIFRYSGNTDDEHTNGHFYLRILTSGDNDNTDGNVLGICYQKSPFSPPESLIGYNYKIMLIRREPYARQFDLGSVISAGGLSANSLNETDDDKLVSLRLLKSVVNEINSSNNTNSSNVPVNNTVEPPSVAPTSPTSSNEIDNSIGEDYVRQENLEDSVISIMSENTSANSQKLQNVQIKKFVENQNSISKNVYNPNETLDFIPIITEEIDTNNNKYITEQHGNKKTVYGYTSSGGEKVLTKLSTNKIYKSANGKIVEQIIPNSSNIYQYTFGNTDNKQIHALYDMSNGSIYFQDEDGQPVSIQATLNSSSSIKYKTAIKEFLPSEYQNTFSELNLNNLPTNSDENKKFTSSDNVSALQALHELPLSIFQYKNEDDTKKRYFGILTERLIQLRNQLENERDSLSENTKTTHKVIIGKDNYSKVEQEQGQEQVIKATTIDMGVDYKYSDEQLDYIIKQLYMLTNNNENAQNIISSIGLLFQSAKETQDRLLALEASTFGVDSPTIPGNQELPDGWKDNDIISKNYDKENNEVIKNKINQIPTVYGLNRLIRALCGEIFGDFNPKALSGFDNSDVNLSRIDYLHREICGQNYDKYDESGSWSDNAQIEIDNSGISPYTYPDTVTGTSREDAFKTDTESQVELEPSNLKDFKNTSIEDFEGKSESSTYTQAISEGIVPEKIEQENNPRYNFDGINDAINRICKKVNQLTININGDNNINRRPEMLDRMRDNIETLIREVFDNEYTTEGGLPSQYVDNGELSGKSYKKIKLSRIDNILKSLYDYTVKSVTDDVTFLDEINGDIDSQSGDEIVEIDDNYGETKRAFNGKKIRVNVNKENNTIINYSSVAPETIENFQYATIIDIIVDLIIGKRDTQKQLVRGNSNVDTVSEITSENDYKDNVDSVSNGVDGEFLGNDTKRSQFRRQESILQRIKQLECVVDYIVAKFDNKGLFEDYGNLNNKGERELSNGSSYSNISSLDDFMNWIAGYTGLNVNGDTKGFLTNPTTDNSTFETLLNQTTNTHLHNAVYDIAARLKEREYGYEETQDVLGSEYHLRDYDKTKIKVPTGNNKTGLLNADREDSVLLEGNVKPNLINHTVSSDVSALLKMVYGTSSNSVTDINHFSSGSEEDAQKREDFVKVEKANLDYSEGVSNIEYLFDELYDLPARYTVSGDEGNPTTTPIDMTSNTKGIFGKDPIKENLTCDDISTTTTRYDLDNPQQGSFLKKGSPSISAKLNSGNISDFKGTRYNRFEVIEDSIKAIRRYLGMKDFQSLSKFDGDIKNTSSFKIVNDIKNGSTGNYKNTWSYSADNNTVTVNKSDSIKISNNAFNNNGTNGDDLSVSKYLVELQREINLLSDQVEYGFPDKFRGSNSSLDDITYNVISSSNIVPLTNEYRIPISEILGDLKLPETSWVVLDESNINGIVTSGNIEYVKFKNQYVSNSYQGPTKYTGGGSELDLSNAILNNSNYYLGSIYNSDTGDSLELYGATRVLNDTNTPIFVKKHSSWGEVDGLLNRVKKLEKLAFDSYTLKTDENNNQTISEKTLGFESALAEIRKSANDLISLKENPNKFAKNYTYVIKDYRDMLLWLFGIKSYYTFDSSTGEKSLRTNDFSHILVRRNTTGNIVDESNNNQIILEGTTYYDLTALKNFTVNKDLAKLGIRLVDDVSAIGTDSNVNIDDDFFYILYDTVNVSGTTTTKPEDYDTEYFFKYDSKWVLETTKHVLKLHTSDTNVWTIDFENSAEPIIQNAWFGFDGTYTYTDTNNNNVTSYPNTLEKLNYTINSALLNSDNTFNLFNGFKDLKDLKVSEGSSNFSGTTQIINCPYIDNIDLSLSNSTIKISPLNVGQTSIVENSCLKNTNISSKIVSITGYNFVESCRLTTSYNEIVGLSDIILSYCRNLNNIKVVENRSLQVLNSCDNISNIEIKVLGIPTNGTIEYLFNTCSNISNIKLIGEVLKAFNGCNNIENVIAESITTEILNECNNVNNFNITSDSNAQSTVIKSNKISNCDFQKATIKGCKSLNSVKADIFAYNEKLNDCTTTSTSGISYDNSVISGAGFIYCQDLDSCKSNGFTNNAFNSCANMRNCYGKTDTYTCTVQKLPSFINFSTVGLLEGGYPIVKINAYNLANNTAEGGWNYIENI